MPTLLDRKHFVCADLSKNSNKFWIISRYDNNDVETHYGRVGDDGAKTVKSFADGTSSKKFFDSKVREKSKVKTRRDAYTEIHLASETVSSVGANRHISDIAAEQIETSSDEIRKLVRWFSDINIHNICVNTQIKYDVDAGSFSTPLGVVDQGCINEAKKLLDKISKFDNVEDKECIKLINHYIRYLPQDLGSSHQKIRASNVFGSSELLQRQQDLIEGLETAIGQAKPVSSTESERVFNTKLDVLKDVQEIERIRSKYNKYKPYSNINNIYTLNINNVYERFLKVGKPIGNIDRYWHATNPANILSIFKNGLIIPKKYSNGWNHGPGIYFSDRSDKSIRYAPSSYREGQSYRYMFVSEVAAGNILYDTGKSQLSKQYNSRWAHKNNSDSQIIVYDVGQINLLYLVELEG